jgi:NTP pyrophosphatase (non-canonical NTP hydrolase)
MMEIEMTTLYDEHADMVYRLAKDGDAILESLSPEDAHLLHMLMGLAGEVGELVDAIKKAIIYGKDLDRDNAVEELGDIEFYLEGLRQGLDIDRDETLAENIMKLETGEQARYTDGYSDEAAINRADKAA